MPLYEISPPHHASYTSPFQDYGLGADATSAAPATSVDAVMQQPVEEGTDWMAYLSPVIAGLVLAIMSYGITRKFDVPPDKALRIAATMGGVTALGHGLSNWLFKQTEPLRQQLPGADIVPVPTSK